MPHTVSTGTETRVRNAFCGVRLKAINARGAQPRGIYDSCMIPTNRTNCVQTVIQTVGKTVQTVQTVAIKVSLFKTTLTFTEINGLYNFYQRFVRIM